MTPSRPEPLTPSDGGGWRSLAALYESAFPAREREAIHAVAGRVAEDRYRVLAVRGSGGRVLGFAIVDRVPNPGYAAVTFLAVHPEWRGRGLGLELVRAAMVEARTLPLFVEAQPMVAGLYRRCGFQALAFDYRVPAYDSAQEAIPMWLLVADRWLEACGLAGAFVADVVGHMFRDGYGVTPDDHRLISQLRRIPDPVYEVGASLSPVDGHRVSAGSPPGSAERTESPES